MIVYDRCQISDCKQGNLCCHKHFNNFLKTNYLIPNIVIQVKMHIQWLIVNELLCKQTYVCTSGLLNLHFRFMNELPIIIKIAVTLLLNKINTKFKWFSEAKRCSFNINRKLKNRFAHPKSCLKAVRIP